VVMSNGLATPGSIGPRTKKADLESFSITPSVCLENLTGRRYNPRSSAKYF
jgi:hypothetical protein